MPRDTALTALDRDLREHFGDRLKSLVTYRSTEGPTAPIPTLAVVDRLTAGDLRACAGMVESWQSAGLATPLLLDQQEFGQSLDAFPFEFGAILADHVLVSGVSPFDGLRVDASDLRRACEVQARSHLLHLREGYLQTYGRSDGVARIILDSAAPLAALLKNVARLDGRTVSGAHEAAAHVEAAIGAKSGALTKVVAFAESGTVSSEQARLLFPDYLEALRMLTESVDRWGSN